MVNVLLCCKATDFPAAIPSEMLTSSFLSWLKSNQPRVIVIWCLRIFYSHLNHHRNDSSVLKSKSFVGKIENANFWCIFDFSILFQIHNLNIYSFDFSLMVFFLFFFSSHYRLMIDYFSSLLMYQCGFTLKNNQLNIDSIDLLFLLLSIVLFWLFSFWPSDNAYFVVLCIYWIQSGFFFLIP